MITCAAGRKDIQLECICSAQLQGSISPTFYAKLLCLYRSQKCKMTENLIAFLGSVCVKAAQKMFVKLTPDCFEKLILNTKTWTTKINGKTCREVFFWFFCWTQIHCTKLRQFLHYYYYICFIAFSALAELVKTSEKVWNLWVILCWRDSACTQMGQVHLL